MLSVSHTSSLLSEFEKELKVVERQNNLLEEKASKLTDTIKKAIKNDYDLFLKSDDRGKEDIIIQWERIKKEISDMILPSRPTDAENGNFLPRKIHGLLDVTIDFENKIKYELYGNAERVYSQKELEELAAKFSHLPKEILDDLASDKYSEIPVKYVRINDCR